MASSGEGVHDLLSGRVLGHVNVDDPTAVVGENDEDEQDTEAGGGHGEAVDRDHVGDMVGEERAPGLRGLGAPLRHEPGDGALGDIDPELREFPVDARRTPQGIRGGHLSHKGGDLGIDARTASGRPIRELGPVLAEASALPS